jgi:pyrroline-5-carboxylate reductase
VKTVFLGGGRITSALIAGLRLTKYAEPILVYDRHAAKLRALKKQFGVSTESQLRAAVTQADVLVVAVRPGSVAELLQQIGNLEHAVVAVSLAAGIPLKQLRAALRSPVLWARAMPSPVCRIGRGLTALTFSRGFPQSQRARLRNFFSNVGVVLELPESKFDAFTVSYSPSHGYHALATLAKAGEQIGLDRKTALSAAAHALGDGITSWCEGDLSLAELLHEAATPGGIAATTMETMNKSGYLEMLKRSLQAGVARAKANAKSHSR